MSGFQFLKDIGRDGGSLQRYHVDAGHASILAPGDHVKLTGTAFTDGIAEVDAATAAAVFLGVIVGVEIDHTSSLTEQGLPALTAGYILVNQSPTSQYIVSGDGATALAVTDVSLNFDSTVTAATRSGAVTRSNFVLDTTTSGVNTVAQWKVIALVDGDVTTAQKIIVQPVELYSLTSAGA